MIYWIKRFFTNIFAEKDSFYCPECLSKLKRGYNLIIYETVLDHVSSPNNTPPSRPYFYCGNEKCTLHGSPELNENGVIKPNEMFWDIYGSGDYCGFGNKPGICRIQDWRKKHDRLVYYSTPASGWLLKKGLSAVNSSEAKIDYDDCLKSTKVGNIIVKIKKKFR